MKVMEIIRSTSMPISAEASLSSETERMALPRRVRWTNWYSAIIKNAAATMTSDLEFEDADRAQDHRPLQRLDDWVGLKTGSVKTPEDILQEKRRADGGDERYQPRSAAQGPVGDAIREDTAMRVEVAMEMMKINIMLMTG